MILTSRRLLVSPRSVVGVDLATQRVQATLDAAGLAARPEAVHAYPVSRQQRLALARF